MKDRIRQLMESQHMTQQVFADYIGTTPATLSGIFNDRTRPTINIVESIKKKFPDISLDWLMFGQGSMYGEATVQSSPAERTLFDDQATSSGGPAPVTPHPSSAAPSTGVPEMRPSALDIQEGVKDTLKETLRDELKNIYTKRRRVCEIRVFYDDGSYESFLPSKS